MKKSFLFILALLVSLLSFSLTSSNSRIAGASSDPKFVVKKQDEQSKLKKNFAPAKRLLTAKGVPFDPEILLAPDWKKKLSPFLAQMSEMQTTLRTSSKIRGVQIADTIILPEQTELTGDTVIIANTIVFEGNHTIIQGIGKNVYIFPVRETGNLGTTFRETAKKQGFSENSILPVNGRTDETLNFILLKVR